MIAYVHDNRCKAGAGKRRTIVEVKQFFCLWQGNGIRMVVVTGFRAGSGYELFFTIALETARLLVNAERAPAKINHLSKLGKEKDKEGEYGEGSFHALL